MYGTLTLLIAFTSFVHVAQGSTYAGVDAVYPNDTEYATERLTYNTRYNLYPYAITFPSTADDVSAVVKQGVKDALQVVARSGSHSYIANGVGGDNGALVIDLGNFNDIIVDPTTFNVVIGPGNTLGDVALGLNEYDRAIPHGNCPYVGVGGHSSFGGWGFTSRMWGLMLDNVISATVVLANGTIVTASATENSDLFWAVRGAAPSYGIILNRTYKTYPQPTQGWEYWWQWELTAEQATNALLVWQNFTANDDIPSYLGGMFAMEKGSSYGNITVVLNGGWFSDPSNLNSTLEPFLGALPAPATYWLEGGTYIEALTAIAGGSLNTSTPETPNTFYAKSLMTPEAEPLTYDAVYAYMNGLATTGFSDAVSWVMEVELVGGTNSATNAVPVASTSFAKRDAQFTMQFLSYPPNSEPPFPEEGFTLLDSLVSDIVNKMPEDWDYGMYTNYVDSNVTDWQKLYYGEHYPRLQSIKETYDPDNVFHFLTSIQEPRNDTS